MPEKSNDKDEVLRKIGRNVVVLQKMEAIAKRPLGHLVSEFLSSAYSSSPDGNPVYDAVRNATISVSFTLDPGMEKEHAESLSSIVTERNTLIHQMLISFDPNCASSREGLAHILDEQLDRVLPEYQLLNSLLVGIKESLEHAESQLDLEGPSGRS